MINNVFVVFIMLGFVSSSPVTHTMLNNKTYAPSFENNVEVYIEKPPDKPYEKFSLITTDAGPLAISIQLTKNEAAKFGADAILLASAEEVKQAGFFLCRGVQHQLLVAQQDKCIHFTQ